MAYSREIIKKITQYVRFRVPRTNEKDSYYTEIGNSLIRISNHCTWMKVWDNMLKENPKWQGKTIISVVFEDNGNTFSEECLFSLGYRRRPIKIREYVYNSSSLSKQDINLIIKSLQNLMKSNNFIDLSKKGIPNNRISVCPDYNNIETPSDGIPSKGGYNGADFVPESKQNNKQNINSNRNMNKNRIRLTESQLRQIIKESVDSILKEGSKEKDPMSQWFNDFNKASKYRETMDYVNKGGRNPLSKKKEDDGVSESYNKLNGLHRLAYENQGMKEKIKEVAQFADIVAGVAHSEGRDNYAKFYKPLASNIFQMLNLWGFLDNIDD